MPDGKAADIFAYTTREVIEAVKKIAESDSICTCKARVICTSATEDSVPHHILYLSEDFIQWLIGVEGQYNYPYLCRTDNNDAKKLYNITLGIGFTFDDTGYHWDILRDYLGWTDEEIKTIIEGVYKGKDYSNSQFAITDEQAYEI